MLKKKNLKRLLTLLLIIACAVPSFAQKKKAPPPTKLKKFYNNVTHRYNGYFNANVKMDEAVKKLAGQHQENYNQILPMYKHLAGEKAVVANGDLDVVITKAGVAISLHRISHWTDDSYLLIGQAEFLKGEYQNAERTFGYIITELDPKKLAEKNKKKKKKNSSSKKEKEKKKKKGEMNKVYRPRDKFGNIIEEKVDEKKLEAEKAAAKTEEKEAEKVKKSPFWKHRPAHKEAFLWLARTQIAAERYDEAFIVLNRLRREKSVPRKVRAEVEAAEAYALLKQKEYERAIVPLEAAIKLTKDRKQKQRYTYILAQLHQLAGRAQDAYASYEQVLKLKPLYEMEFNARLSIAKNAYENGDASIDDAVRDLEKMLKDEKNEEYLDQIYFALADVELRRNNTELAINHLKKSVFKNQNNRPQKAEAYYLLAELSFKTEKYAPAKYYYDSTLTVIAESDERRAKVQERSVSLKEIAENIEIIALKDSLIAISRMNEDDRMALALKIKEQEAKQQKDAKNAKIAPMKGRNMMLAEQPQAAAAGREVAGNAAAQPIGTWWAYDADNIRKGKRTFEQKWGQRPLSDDWRRANRKGAGVEEGNEPVQETVTFAALTTAEMEAIFDKMGVPKDENQARAMEGEIAQAMATLGPLFRDRLKNNGKAIEILEELMRRYPQNKHKLESAYLLYVMYKEKPDFAKVNFYKDLILNADKESKYAKAILDPNFMENANLTRVRINDYYDNAYALFEKGNAKLALEKIDNVDKVFPPKENHLRPKFDLLAAMCEGSLNGKEAYKIALNDVVKTHAKTEEADKAAQILKYLAEDGTAAATATTTKPTAEDGLYNMEDGQHFFIARFDAEVVEKDRLVAAFTDFNKENHNLERLRASAIYLDLQTPLLVVKRFNTRDDAMRYYKSVTTGNIEQFLKGDLNTLKITPMVISQDNYKTLVTKKKLDEYLTFFEVRYK